MDHTAPAPKNPDARDDTRYPNSLANPRRIRLGADGRPIAEQTRASSN
jgi:hypothetical protein